MYFYYDPRKGRDQQVKLEEYIVEKQKKLEERTMEVVRLQKINARLEEVRRSR